MLLLELAGQGVRGFSPSIRVALKSGYVALKSPSELPAPVSGLLMALAYPDGRGGDAAYLAPGVKAGRAGISIQGQDENVWRIVRDLGGAGGLHMLNRATNQFDVVTQDASEMAQVLKSTVGFPSRAILEQLFVFVAGQQPSRRPRRPKSLGAAGHGGMPSAMDQYGFSSDEGQLRERLKSLEAELAKAKEAADLQFRFDGLQADAFKAEAKAKDHAALAQKLEAARAELAAVPTAASLGLPDDIIERVKRLPEEKKRKQELLQRLAAEKEAAMAAGPGSVEPLYRNRDFMVALLAGLGLLVGSAFLDGGLRWISLLSIPAFSFAALLALRFIEELQHVSREAAKTEIFSSREEKILSDFASAASLVEMALEKTGAMTQDEFFAVMKRRDELEPGVKVLEAELDQMAAEADLDALPRQLAQLKAEMNGLNEKLEALSGGYVREVREIERDLAKVREMLAPPKPVKEASTGSAEGPEPLEDPMPAVMALGSELFAADVLTLWTLLRERAVQYYAALTDRRYQSIELDHEGRAAAVGANGPVEAGKLPAKDLDLLYLSIRLTLLEKYCARAQMPIIIEDAFAGTIEPAKQSLFGRMLKHLGSLSQVLHVTSAGQNAAAAETVVAL